MAAETAGTVAIVGGGPAGLALSLALRRHGIGSEIFEARPRQAVRDDKRVLALSDGSRQILEWLGVWTGLPATAMETIHVSHRGGFGRTVLHARELGCDALGWVVAARDLIPALDDAAAKAAIPYRDGRKTEAGELSGHALVAFAEGRIQPGEARSRDYGQHAVLCDVETVAPHGQVAYERFTPDGPLALLPLQSRYSVVMTCSEGIVNEVATLSDTDFLDLLQRRFGTRHRFLSATPRVSYALGLRYRPLPVGPRQVWLGNAAQTLHPVAGQGFNLALRDIWELASALRGEADPGNADVLRAYARRRRLDRYGAMGFTDLLIRGFSNDLSLLRHGRGAGLLALDLLPPLRTFVAKRMMYGARAWP